MACEYLAGVLGEGSSAEETFDLRLESVSHMKQAEKSIPDKNKNTNKHKQNIAKKKKKNPHSSRKDGDKMASACRITYVILLTLLEEGEGALLRAAKHHALFIW